MSDRPVLQLVYCPGCDTYAPAVASGADVDQGLGARSPMFASLPFPPLCSTCWMGLYAVVKLHDRERLKLVLGELDAKITRNLAKQRAGQEQP